MSEVEHLGERQHLRASKIRPTGASRTSATPAGKPFVHCPLFPLSCVSRAGSLLVTTLSSWTRTCTPGETWTWSWKVVDLGQAASWRRKRKEAAGERRAGSYLLSWLLLHRLYHSQLLQLLPPISFSQERPPSPGHALKMDSYLCPGQDHLTAPYLPDGTIDYTNMDY